MLRRAHVLALAVLTVLVVAAPAAAAPLTFDEPVFVDESWPGGEPVLITDTFHNKILMSSHEGTTHIYRPGLPAVTTFQWVTEYRNQVKMWSSADGGSTWKRLQIGPSGFGGDPSKNQGFSDPDWAMDASGRVYNTSINLASQAIFSSADGGETWDKGNPECRPGDRPWLAAADKDHAFLATNAIDEGGALNHRIFETKDGGTTCSATGIPNQGSGYSGNGKLLYDHASKMLIEPTQWGNDGLGIATWKEGELAFTPYKGVEGTSIYAHWPMIAQDGAGTVYLVWDTNPTNPESPEEGCDGAAFPAPNEIQMIYTKDYGKTWSEQITVARGNNTRVFWPWIAAGDAGKISVVWYETDKVVDLACQQADISVKAATMLNATDAAKRTTVYADVAGRPIANGVDVCQNGTTCVATGEDRRLGDFFTNAIDQRGCVIVATADVTKPVPGSEAPRATSLPLFIRQKSGPRVIGSGDCDGSAGDAPAAPGPSVSQPQPIGTPTKGCGKVRIPVKAPKGQRLSSLKVTVNGKKAKVAGKGAKRYVTVDLRKIKGSKYKVKIVGVTGQGRRISSTKTFKKKC